MKQGMSAQLLRGLGLAVVGALILGAARSTEPASLTGLVWRNIGPFRAGRVAAVTGAIGEPGVFYMGLPAGGIWKTSNAGTTWEPIFDSIEDVASVGAIEVAPSDTSVIYAGTGDMVTGGAINEGNGVYKSTDAGRTWKHVGLDSTKQIPSILVDPANPQVVLVAAQGNIHTKTDVRGVYRSTDGGTTWTKTLFVDDSTGIEKLAWAFDKPGVVFAVSNRHYTAPIASRARGFNPGGPTSTKIFKSTDEGVTWHEVTGGGLPALAGRMSVAVAMHTDAQRVFLIGNSGLYRSDDGGASWRQLDSTDTRIRNGQGGYNCGVYVSSTNPDVVYTINTSSYVSTDGGNSFTGFKGAPGGDDPQQMWIDPTSGQRILLGMDQGATVSLDGGRSWSSWYNQSTAQVYHVSADNSYPYWVYAPQQDAGAIRVRSRGNYGAITPMDWSPVGGWEWGTDVADPRNPDILFASGSGIDRLSYPSEQWINVSPGVDPDAHLRTTSSNPLIWAPWNPRQLFAGFQVLMGTTDGGAHWTRLSPDLGYKKGVTPPPDTAPPPRNGPRPGTIESISPSSAATGTIWVGTDNGLVKLTRDGGKTWTDVSIPDLPDSDQSVISAIDASHHTAAEAYVAIDAHRAGDYQPLFFRTRDYGKTWTKIVTGLPTNEPSGSFARVIRADSERSGLLFAGTESSMYVSFDDGDSWRSLRLNLPNTSYRDATIKGTDLIVGTYGRGIWILDDISPLRQMTPETAGEPAHLYKPAAAIRVRRNVNQDTPFPPEVPHALNPPVGAIIYYSLGTAPAGEVTLDVLDQAGHLVRHMSSAPETPVEEAAHPPEPSFWLAPPAALPKAVGLNRTNWDIRYDDPPALRHSYEINANPGETPASPEGPLAPPGQYTVRLTVNGRSYTQTVTVKNDPRSPATTADLVAQHALEMQIYAGISTAWTGYEQARALKQAATDAAGANPPAEVATALKAFAAKVDSVGGSLEGGGRRFGPRGGGGNPPPNFVDLNGTLVRQLGTLEPGDIAPTGAMHQAYLSACKQLATAVTSWQSVKDKDLAAFNALLAQHQLHPAAAAAPALAASTCAAAPAGPRGRKQTP
ncbi:MAG TPA: hypothetical protein VMH88_14995 [Gemmatimonadales bacterium]|nr:hypothetical protein [Gemmatimonadales bacterium]